MHDDDESPGRLPAGRLKTMSGMALRLPGGGGLLSGDAALACDTEQVLYRQVYSYTIVRVRRSIC